MNASLTKTNRNKDDEQVKRSIFFILVSLTIIQQMPIIKDMFYSPIRAVLYLAFASFSFISLFSIDEFFRVNFVKYIILVSIYSLTIALIDRVFNGNSTSGFELLIPFGILICSMNTGFNNRQLGNFLFYYILLSVILGISSIFHYGQGFVIEETYFLAGKNQIGPLLGTSTIITSIWIINKDKFDMKSNKPILKITIFVLLMTSILVIRNRAGLVAIFIVLILAFFKEYKIKKSLWNMLITQSLLIILIILFLLGSFDGVIDAIFNSLFSNYDLKDLNSISAGRTNEYKTTLEFVKRYPVLGQLGRGTSISSIPHNYILNKWLNFGIIASLPMVVFYFYIYFFTIRNIYMRKNKRGFSLPLWTLLFSLIVSSFEYTYPYGPGVSQIMTWFLLGQFFRLNYL